MIKFVTSILIIAVHLEFVKCGSPKLARKNVSIGSNKPDIYIETELVEMPADAGKCSQPGFIDGVSKTLARNNHLIQGELSRNTCECEFGDVEAALRKFSTQIKKIIGVLMGCDSGEKMFNDAIGRYDELKKVYNSAVRRQATASQEKGCGSTLAKIRPALLNSAENIMAVVFKCLNLKKKKQNGGNSVKPGK